MAALVNGLKVCLLAQANAWLCPRNLRSWLSPLVGDFGTTRHGGQDYPDLSMQGQLVTISKESVKVDFILSAALSSLLCWEHMAHMWQWPRPTEELEDKYLGSTPTIQFTNAEIHKCIMKGEVYLYHKMNKQKHTMPTEMKSFKVG